jgi:hypothetical protein
MKNCHQSRGISLFRNSNSVKMGLSYTFSRTRPSSVHSRNAARTPRMSANRAANAAFLQSVYGLDNEGESATGTAVSASAADSRREPPASAASSAHIIPKFTVGRLRNNEFKLYRIIVVLFSPSSSAIIR